MRVEPFPIPSLTPEPRWRIALYWGTVISFFTLPLFVLILHLVFISYPEILHGHGPGHIGEFRYIFEFHRTLAALVFGLAGLHTGEVIVSTIKAREEPEIVVKTETEASPEAETPILKPK
jgi:hypothetical protein